ncbi:MAG: polyphenol oxidase family protein, partial [Coriobacteriia bacterium]|nr:polyphenol oxidase family protein [Coriobacteriia bacterium]
APERGFIPNRPGHWLADLPLMAEMILHEQGIHVDNISNSGLSTFTRPDMHSARRDGDASGRMATFVVLMPEPPQPGS